MTLKQCKIIIIFAKKSDGKLRGMTMKKNVMVIQGPNLNLTGEREKSIYGSDTYEIITKEIMDCAESLGLVCTIFQSNHEGEIIDKIHEARLNCDGIIINAGAYTHYSYAIRDAISAINIPTIEIHMSNIYGREDFRSKSVIAPVCRGHIAGFGKNGYFLALHGLVEML